MLENSKRDEKINGDFSWRRDKYAIGYEISESQTRTYVYVLEY